jgi:hypothetical protein
MTTLTLQQIIFTRVEAAYSPKRDSGYQIVYRSDGVSAPDADETQRLIEAFYVGTSPSQPSRMQYVVLKSGTAMIVRTSVVETDKELMDKDGRRVFLAHAFLLDKFSFDQLESNPFQVIDHARFMTTSGEFRAAVEQYGKATGKIDAASVMFQYPPCPRTVGAATTIPSG